MQEITDEELAICKKLPEHEWEVGDSYYVTELRAIYYIRWKGDAPCISKDDYIWLPHPHQIMELEEWSGGWHLHCGLNIKHSGVPEWYVMGWTEYNIDEHVISSGPTARLACLRAIEPHLPGGDE